MNLNITMLTTGYPRFKGDLFGFFVADLARALTQAHHRVTVVAPGHKSAPPKEEREGVLLRRASYAWPAGLMKLAYGGGLIPNLRARPYLAALLPQFLLSLGLAAARQAASADVFHGQWVVSGWLGLLTRFIHGRPVVATLRGSDLALLRGLPQGAARRLLQGFDVITTVSREIRSAVLELGLDGERVRLIPNGVDTSLFRPGDKKECRADLGLDPNAPLMLYAGRLSPEKGVRDLIRAVPVLLGNHPAAKVILLGDGTLEKELRADIRKRGLERSVEIRPAVPRWELVGWYNAVDLVCLPSHREGRPNTVLEALACGRPVLATEVGGVPELIEHGLNGFLTPSRDPEIFGRAASELLGHPRRREALGLRGPESLARLGLTWERSAELMTEAYVAALRRRAGVCGRDPEYKGGAAALWVVAAWAGLVSGMFLTRYAGLLDQGYGVSRKLAEEGLVPVLGRFLGF